MRKRLPGPEPGHAGQRVGVPGRPVHRARLLFHDPPAAAPHGAIEVVVEGLIVGVALAQEMRLVFRCGVQPVGQEAQGVAVPTGDIQIGANREVIEAGDAAHVVVRDRRGGMLAEDLHLQPVEAGNLVAGKAVKIHHMRRVRLGHGQVRQADVVEAVIVHRPEHIAPGPVQRLRRLVFLRQPLAEGVQRGGRIAERGVMAGVFVIGLPGAQMRVGAVAFGQRGDDAGAFDAIAAVAEVVMAPRAEAARAALFVDGEHVGQLVGHPARRRCGGGAQHDLQPRRAKRFDRPVQPAPVIGAGLRFHPAPRELADADEGEAGLGHAAGVFRPPVLGPVFGVVADAKRAFVGHRITLCSRCPRLPEAAWKVMPLCGQAASSASDRPCRAVVQ